MEKEIVEYNFTEDFKVTPEMKKDFEKYGYVIIRRLLDEEEITLLRTAIEQDEGVQKNAYILDDGEGLQTSGCHWNIISDDITGIVVRSEKLVETAEALMGNEVYLYHTKLSLKEPFTGGSYTWHQDYGYWYENGCPFPDLVTCYLAMDRSTKENGCLQVIPGSHRAGRVDHVIEGEQVAADPTRIEIMKQMLPVVYAELSPGDSIFFHSNMLHRSDQNKSPHRRWGFLSTYNAAYNSPHNTEGHASVPYTKLHKVPNSAIKTASLNLQGIKYVDYKAIEKNAYHTVQRNLVR